MRDIVHPDAVPELLNSDECNKKMVDSSTTMSESLKVGVTGHMTSHMIQCCRSCLWRWVAMRR